LHILYIHQYFNTPEASGGTRSYEMARRFVAAGHRVTMLTSCGRPGFPVPRGHRRGPVRTAVAGIEVLAVQAPYANEMGYARRIASFAEFVVKAAAVSRQLDAVDVVFATSTPLTVAIPAKAAKGRHRCPLVFEVRDLWPEAPIAMGALRDPLSRAAARWLERWAYRNSAHVVALSPPMADGVARTGYPRERISVVPNSCDLDLFGSGRAERFLTMYPQFAGRRLVVYAGTMGRVNGAEYLADIAAHLLHANDIRFAMIGTGGRRAVVHERASALGVLDRNLWIFDPLPKAEMPHVLQAASVSCSLTIDNPVTRANSANKVFDALAAGRPVLINHEGWLADFIRDTGCGLVVPPADALTAARMLRDFLSDEERVACAGAAALRLAKERFSRDLLADDLRLVLERAFAEAHSGRVERHGRS